MVVNSGEDKVRVHMNVVPQGTTQMVEQIINSEV